MALSQEMLGNPAQTGDDESVAPGVQVPFAHTERALVSPQVELNIPLISSNQSGTAVPINVVSSK